LAWASSGIAALLFTGRRTAHSGAKIPINVHADSFCSISAQSELAQLIRLTKLIIWEAVDRTFRDIRKDDRPFGGVTMVFTCEFPFVTSFAISFSKKLIFLSLWKGDFRQCLPVDRAFCGIRKDDRPFGGLTMAFTGDFPLLSLSLLLLSVKS
jgi:hypothetical protein